MGNPDSAAPRKYLVYEDIEPSQSIGETDQGLPVTYEYPILNQVLDSIRVARDIFTQEMAEHLSQRGYEIVDWNSSECRRVLRRMELAMNRQLARFGKELRLEEGMPIMVERGRDSVSMRKINIVFALARKRSEGKGFLKISKVKYYLVAHAVDLDELKLPSIPNQYRSDDGRFQPPLWTVDVTYPFGYRGMFPHLVSYPLKNK